MRKLLMGAALVGSLAMCSGCWTMANGPIMAPIQVSQGPVSVGDMNARAMKVGRSQATGVILVGFGDASIGTAAANGQITKIHHVDSEQLNVFGIYSRQITTVYGE